ncbi:23S rRNA (pseudouridine(1915)-N(3))-methyltransferase RlmH [Alkaliphilus serpentinus]|uniref:Ribosomal RNA large subunit methyltransferase H n=1 Tax=Alkaliphilus serpentinus TaxID=1482731 RepID=A0A833HQT1_9FIRM|nr:23S rRNA (pseudouridine(1915)-N(3))-methyltransferase RlmH [Alkaliphilus serpentinus]KAB3532173.1 23S rRNA (pseudouridine(1915)-N(3))-methyltransferase RlmH [Alkaliphilus serpentinus]
MNITIISVGKIKEKYFKDAILEYSKRLSIYCKLKLIEVQDEKAPESYSQAEILQVKAKEGEGIIKNIKDGSYVIALEVKGKMLSSEDLAEKIQGLGLQGNSHLIFIIGGSLGLSQEVLNRADFKLSFSPMTFPHQLMKVVLLEQIYRAFKINSNEPYHK